MPTTSTNICNNIKIKNFNNINKFTIFLTIIPNSTQILTDEPLENYVSSKSLDSSDILLNDTPLNEHLSFTDDLTTMKDNYENDLKDKINDIINRIKDNLKDPTSSPDCDVTVVNKDDDGNEVEHHFDVKIHNDQGDVIESISSKYKPVATKYCELTGLNDVISNFDINTEIDPFKMKIDDPKKKICNLPDSKIKSALTYTISDDMKNDLDDITSNVKDISNNDDNIKQMFQDITGKELTDLDALNSYYNDLNDEYSNDDSKNISFSLGIPLVVFDKDKKIILQINKKKLEVIMLVDDSMNYLHLDKEIDLTRKLYIAFKTNGFTHELYLKQENDDKVYYQSLTTPMNLGLCYIGIDPEVRKKYCGLITDIVITTDNKQLSEYVEDDYDLETPKGALYYYNWDVNLIDRNLVYSTSDNKTALHMNGMFGSYRLENTRKYRFAYNTYFTELFCFIKSPTSIFTWNIWFKIDHETYLRNNGKGYIFDDALNLNNIHYNYYTKQFVITTQYGETYEYDFYLQENIWYNFMVKYDQESNIFILKIMNLNEEVFENTGRYEIVTNEIEFNFPQKISFTINTIYAKNNNGYYEDFFVCKNGTIAIFDKITSNFVDETIFKKQILTINNLKL